MALQTELISGDQNGNIRVWDLTANSCSCELVCANVLYLQYAFVPFCFWHMGKLAEFSLFMGVVTSGFHNETMAHLKAVPVNSGEVAKP